MAAKRKPRAAQLGVTDAEYDRLLAAQGGGCAICGNPPKTRRLHVDHDHKTERVRGLLDHRCNRALPSWVTPKWLLRAAEYLGWVDPLPRLLEVIEGCKCECIGRGLLFHRCERCRVLLEYGWPVT